MHDLINVDIGEFERFWEVFTTAAPSCAASTAAFLADPDVPPTTRSGGANGSPEARVLEPAGELAA